MTNDTQQLSTVDSQQILVQLLTRMHYAPAFALEVAELLTRADLLDHIPAVKALRKENERLKIAAKYAEHIDATPENQLQTMLYDTCIERDALKSQLAELHQGGEAVYQAKGPDSKEWTEVSKPKFDFYADSPEIGVKVRALFTRPQPAIPPGYVVVKSELFEAVAALVRFAGDWNQGAHAKLYRPVICRLVGEHIAEAPAIQPQAVAPSVPVAEKEDTARLDFLDSMNARKNQQNNSKYGWRLSENHNRIALEDHNFPSKTVREAIDEFRRAAKNTEQ